MVALALLLALAVSAAGCEEPVSEPPAIGFTVAQQECADGSCMLVTGRATVDGRPAPTGAPIDAYVGGRPCGATVAGAGGAYTLRVAGDAVQSGCASPGAVIAFEVYGAEVDATAVYQSATTVALDLTGQGDAPALSPTTYCFEPALLPTRFVAQPARTLPNGRSAETDIAPGVPAAERPARIAERLQVYARQGRRTGFQLTFADPRFLRALGMDGQGPAPDAQTRTALLRALSTEPLSAAQCQVGLYRTEQGAEAAYIETAGALLAPPVGATEYRRVDAPDGDAAGAAVFRSPEWGGICVYLGVFRVATISGVIAVLAPVEAATRPCTELAGPGRLLMWSMVDRIRASNPTVARPSPGGAAQGAGAPSPTPARPAPSAQPSPGLVRPAPSVK